MTSPTDTSVVDRYVQEARRSVARLQELAEESERWTQIDETNGVKIYQQEPEADRPSLSVFKGVGVIDAPPHIVFELLTDSQRVASYDSIFEKATLIEEITNNIKVENHCYWAPFPVKSRDFCLFLHKSRLADGTICLVGKSTTHDRVPESGKYVRGEIVIGGWLLKGIPASGGGEPGANDDAATKTHAIYIACPDLKGSIPDMVKRKLHRKQPALVDAIRPVLAKRVKELASMKDEATRDAILDAIRHKLAGTIIYTDEELKEAREASNNTTAQ